MKNKEAKSIFSSLENFSSNPPPDLWDKIEAQLEEPKKKKRPVIWWWAAAVLVAGLSVPAFLYDNSNQDNILELNIGNNANGVVLQNDSKNNLKDSKNENTIEKISLDKKNNSATEIKNENFMVKQNSISVANTNSTVVTTTPVIPSKKQDSKIFQNSKREEHSQFIAEENSIAQSEAIAANKIAKANSYNAASIIGTNNTSLLGNSNANTKTIASSDSNTASETEQNKEGVKSTNPKLTVTSINGMNNTSLFSNSKANTKTIAISENNTASESKQNKETVKRTNPKSTYVDENGNNSDLISNKAIAENTNAKDSLNTIKKEVAQLENALAELNKKDKDKKKTSSEVIDKWSLQVFAGVMSSENFNNEKALGNTVASKQSSGYGVKTNYKLNKKWAVSSGFKINELGQKIDGVAYYERSSALNSPSGVLPITPGNVSLDISSNNNIVFASTNENYLFASNSKTASGFETGNVTQNLRYFEMPVEISYALLSKKKTNIIMNTGGFVGKLISNDVLLNGSSIGENNNVNEFVYGTLLSSTFQYEFYRKTKFFIEPGVNYYINPLENQSFNQFQWMFNVGINVSF